MEYRVLVDENTSPRVAVSLRDTGIFAEHVTEVLSEGVDDDTIATYARENNALVLTHDPDFLDIETRSGVSVFYRRNRPSASGLDPEGEYRTPV